MSDNQDLEGNDKYFKFYGNQDSNLQNEDNENTHVVFEKEGPNDEKLKSNSPIKLSENKKSPFTNEYISLKEEEKTTKTKTYKEQKEENEVNSCIHSITDLINDLIRSYDPIEKKLQYPDLKNLLETWSLKEIKKFRIYMLYIFDSLDNKKVLDNVIKKESESKSTFLRNFMDFTIDKILNYFLKDDKIIIHEPYIYELTEFKTYYDKFGQKKVINKKRKRTKYDKNASI